MDDMISSMSKSIIEKATSKILHHFEFSIENYSGIGLKALMELNELSKKDPIIGPCALFITVGTKKSPKILVGLIALVVRSLVNSGLVKQERIREMYFSRTSSIEEKVDVYLVALDD